MANAMRYSLVPMASGDPAAARGAGGAAPTTTDGWRPGSPAGLRRLPVADARRLWVRLLREPWTSLVLAPTHDAALAHEIATAGADAAQSLGLATIHVVDARGARPADTARLRSEIEEHVASQDRVVICVEPPLDQPVAMALLAGASAAVLVVRLGASRLDTVRRIAEVAPRGRILGCVTHR